MLDTLFGLHLPHLLTLLAEAGLLLGPLNLVDAIVQTVLKRVSELDQISEKSSVMGVMVVIVWSAALKASSKVQFLQLTEGRAGEGSSLAADHCQNVLEMNSQLLKAWEPRTPC